MMDNKKVFGTVEFDIWANKEKLIEEEKYLIETYLDRTGKTIEAGTAGGRILLEMKQMGFTSLAGYDYVPELIEKAKKRDATQSISFEVQDATSLNYDDASFDHILYLQQIICVIENDSSRLKAMEEAYRILKKGGIALFSFLSFETRVRTPIYQPYLGYLSLIRKLRGSNRSLQYIPWLKLGGKPNWLCLLDRGPYPYWYKLEEADRMIKKVGFQVVAVGSGYQLKQGTMSESIEILANERLEGMLYFVCKK
jgi:SAM-dependent methyltransferase